jgi:tRNA threonylcarbamoyladenosine dehydratase
VNAPSVLVAEGLEADLERRFGGLRRLYGDSGYARVRGLRVAVVGVGGVGSWAAEALARCGVAQLVLVDLDHVAESNINRQVHALGATLGQAKVLALQERIADIHPGCDVVPVEAFVEGTGPQGEPGNWPGVLPAEVDLVIDACDQRQAKLTMAHHALKHQSPLVIVGAAGGKRLGHKVDVADLSEVTHDPLLAALRQNLRRSGAAARQGTMGLRCVFSREPVALPARGGADACATDGSLNCHGYGSTVTVTAAFGFAAAAEAIEWAIRCAGTGGPQA